MRALLPGITVLLAIIATAAGCGGDGKGGPGPDLPIWVPGDDPEAVGFARISNKKALATGLKYRPVEQTVVDTLAYDTVVVSRTSLIPEVPR